MNLWDEVLAIANVYCTFKMIKEHDTRILMHLLSQKGAACWRA